VEHPVSWLFLAVSLWGAWFTWNAFRPSRRWHLLWVSFFAAWFTGELALWHLAWQAVGAAAFVAAGALGHWAGWVGLAVTLVSWVGLVRLFLEARASAAVIDATLSTDLGLEDAPLERRVPLRQLVAPLYLRDRRVERVRNLAYGPAGRRNRLDVYRPTGGPDRPAPVLLQVHGGAWVVGSKEQQGLPLMLEMAASGWVCVAANYRLSPRARWPEHLVDLKRAVAWIRGHIAEFGGDPTRVHVTGGSAGGHLAAMLALTAGEPRFQPGFEDVDTRVVSCVPFYGVYDLTTLFDAVRGGARLQRLGARFQRLFMGTSLAEAPEAFRDASPIAWVRPDAPPFFVVHGEADNLVPVAQARAFVAALRAVSAAPVCYAEIPGASHAFDVFHSVRTANAVHGVRLFLEHVDRARPRGGADALHKVPDGG
jgi:acetyl esterase/lipase